MEATAKEQPMDAARRRLALSTLSSALFLLSYPVFVHSLLDGAEPFGAFAVVPIAILAWNYGQRNGALAAVVAVVFTQAAFCAE